MALSREGERRRCLRLYELFPALVRGVDTGERVFDFAGVVSDGAFFLGQ